MEWKRKNPLVRELRRQLRNFRIVEMRAEMSAEMKVTGEATGDLNAFEQTGRECVTYHLYGYRRGPRHRVVLLLEPPKS